MASFLCLCHQVAVVDLLSPSQRAELMLDPKGPALEDQAVAREVLTSLTESHDDDQLAEFFQEFANITDQVTTYFEDCHILMQMPTFDFRVDVPPSLFSFSNGHVRKEGGVPELTFHSFHHQRNVTFLANAGVRDTVLNVTLTALAPNFQDFRPEDFKLWFQRLLLALMASFRPGSVELIPRNISCQSYGAM